jgi:hypothetical protein
MNEVYSTEGTCIMCRQNAKLNSRGLCEECQTTKDLVKEAKRRKV